MPNPLDDLDDLLLVGRIAARDEAAFARFYDRHARLTLGLLLRILGDRAAAEEVLAEVFEEVWRAAGGYGPHCGSPQGWVFRLARGRALGRLRSATPRGGEAAGADREGGGDGPRSAVPPALPSPEAARGAGGALGRLAGEEREAIELAFFAGLSQRQIAARLGAPLSAVQLRLRRGMSALREALRAAR